MKYISVLLCALILCLVACTPKFRSDATKWVYYATDKKDKLYYTLNKIDKIDNGIMKIWVKTVFGTTLRIDDKNATYAKNMYMINCNTNTYKMNVGYFFSATDEILSKTTSTQPDVMPLILDKSNREFTFKPISTVKETYYPILPNSSVEKLKDIACKQ